MTCPVLTFFNNKGGVGKTSLVYHLAWMFAEQGKTVVGVDIDPKAEDIARENAAYNGYHAPEFTALTGNVLADKALMEQLTGNRYDLVLVNIVADVIIGLAPALPKLLDGESTLICSGILDTRLADVQSALTGAGLRVVEICQEEEWRCICVKRRSV